MLKRTDWIDGGAGEAERRLHVSIRDENRARAVWRTTNQPQSRRATRFVPNLTAEKQTEQQVK